MKTLFYTASLLSLFFISACSHTNPSPAISGYGSWVLDDTLHTAVRFGLDTFNSRGTYKYIEAIDSTDFDEIRFTFNGSVPVASGDIAISQYNPTGSQVGLDVMSLTFFSGGATGNDPSQKVSVTVVNNKLRFSGSNIRIEDQNGHMHTIQRFDLQQQ